MDTIRRLREETQAGIMDCKRALQETGGDFDAAKELLAEQGKARADKLSDREAEHGRVASYIHNDRVGALVHVGCNTDFVARGNQFAVFCQQLAVQAVAVGAASVDELLASVWMHDGDDGSRTVEDLRADLAARVGENVVVLDVKLAGV